MTIENDLKNLVSIYSVFDKEKKAYTAQLDKETLLRLDRDFIKFLNQQLLLDGPDQDELKKHYKKMTRYFHPDRRSEFLPEVIWIEQNLSLGTNNGACFKSLRFCFEKLTDPDKFKESHFENIRSNEECKKWLERLREQSTTYTGRSLYDSLIGLLDQMTGFFDETGRIKPKGLKVLVTFIPMIFATYGTFIFAEELFAIYTLYFIALKGGQYLEQSNALELKNIGKTLQEISIVTATATTTIIVRLLEMTFWASRQCLDMTLQIGSSLLNPYLPSRSAEEQSELSSGANLCKDLILASKNLSEGIQFKTPELKVIAAPLESYRELNGQQFFVNWRTGGKKRLAVEAFLFQMRVLDEMPYPIEEKIKTAELELEKIKSNKEVYTKKTAEAVSQVEQVITLLKEVTVSDMQLVVSQPQSNAQSS